MHLEDVPEVNDITKVARLIAEFGWAKANAGNISLRLDRAPPEMGRMSPREPWTLPAPTPELSGKHFLFTAAGSRMQDIPDDPEANLLLLRITEDGSFCEVLWGAPKVSSEFKAHVAAHRTLAKKRPEFRAVLHAHPPGLRHMKCFTDRENVNVSEAVSRVFAEVRDSLPEGFAVVPYFRPGSNELAEATGRALTRFKVALWERHGAIAVGRELKEALAYIQVLERAAQDVGSRDLHHLFNASEDGNRENK